MNRWLEISLEFDGLEKNSSEHTPLLLNDDKCEFPKELKLFIDWNGFRKNYNVTNSTFKLRDIAPETSVINVLCQFTMGNVKFKPFSVKKEYLADCLDQKYTTNILISSISSKDVLNVTITTFYECNLTTPAIGAGLNYSRVYGIERLPLFHVGYITRYMDTENIKRVQDNKSIFKIVSITQNNQFYTIFYKMKKILLIKRVS